MRPSTTRKVARPGLIDNAKAGPLVDLGSALRQLARVGGSVGEGM